MNSWRPITASQAAARAHIVEAASGPGFGRFDVVAESGCGKTSLLAQVALDLQDRGYCVLYITAPAAESESPDEMSRATADRVVCDALIKGMAGDAERLAEQLRDQRSPDADQVTRAAQRIGVAVTAGPPPPRDPDQDVLDRYPELLGSGPGNLHTGPAGAVIQVGHDVSGGITVNVDPDALETARRRAAVDRVRERMVAMREQLVAAVEQLSRLSPVAILVDESQRLAGEPRRWLRDVFDELPRILAVCSRLAGFDAAIRTPDRELRLDLMTSAEIDEFLTGRLGEWPADRVPPIVELIGEISEQGRYPAWVATWAQMIGAKFPAGASPGEVRELLSGGLERPDLHDHVQKVGEFIDHEAAMIVGKDVRLFDYLRILRRVSGFRYGQERSMLGTFLDIPEDKADALYLWLTEAAFVSHFDDDEELGFRLHDQIRLPAAKRLSEKNRTRYRQLHQTVEQYHREFMNFDTEVNEESPWAAWYRYEDPVWRLDCRNWLSYAEHLAPEAFKNMIPALVRLFLEEFWWWEMDTSTEFSVELLGAYRTLADKHRSRPGDIEWLRRLEELRAGYISTWSDRVPGQHPERWRLVRSAANALLNMFRLNTRQVAGNPVQRRIQILCRCLMGEAERYGLPDTERNRQRAARWYTAAMDACTTEDEQWIKVWVIHIRADIWCAADPRATLLLVDGLAGQIDELDPPERELRAHLTRTLADVAWGIGARGLAFDILTRAVLHAYVYQVRQELDRQAPSDYTHMLYDQRLRRFETRLKDARAAGEDELADAAIARMRAFFAPYWESWPEDVPTQYGFPPGPQPEDLYRLGTPFTDRVESVLSDMAGELGERPLDLPLDIDESAA